jgi:signal transduction histidine kinase
MLSLRARVLLGAVLWTVGLVLLSFAIISHVARVAPDLPFLGRRGSIHVIWASHAFFIVVTAAISLLGGAWQVRRGLSGISQLRTRLADVHGGRDARVEGRYVPEVQPLVDDLNALIEQREQAVQRAIAKAGDLAHGLKTPLALLASEAERAGATGQSELAAAIGEQVERMRRQIDYHLAHARAAASGSGPGARSVVQESAEALVRTMHRLHADRHLSIDMSVPASDAVRVQREDLDEMLGNLLDNACKWAGGRVVIESVRAGDRVVITVDDDGPGLATDMRETVLLRGVRADQKAAGSGLGLAIVRDLAELYDGSISLGESPLGGLRASLTLRAADPTYS